MSQKKKMIVLGVDGMDPRFTRYMLERKEMPNVQKLIDAGFEVELLDEFDALASGIKTTPIFQRSSMLWIRRCAKLNLSGTPSWKRATKPSFGTGQVALGRQPPTTKICMLSMVPSLALSTLAQGCVKMRF